MLRTEPSPGDPSASERNSPLRLRRPNMNGPSLSRVLRLCPVYGIPMLYLWAMSLLSVVSLLALLVILGGLAHVLVAGGAETLRPLDPLLVSLLAWFPAPTALWVVVGVAGLLGGVYLMSGR